MVTSAGASPGPRTPVRPAHLSKNCEQARAREESVLRLVERNQGVDIVRGQRRPFTLLSNSFSKRRKKALKIRRQKYVKQ